MKYGYYNYYITDIGEDVSAITKELETYADKVVVESLSYAPRYFELLDEVKAHPDGVFWEFLNVIPDGVPPGQEDILEDNGED